MKHTAQKLAAVAAIGATVTLSLATPAFAHDQLVSVTPSQDSQQAVAPQEIVMEFSGDIMAMDGANQVKVVDAEGNTISDGDPIVDGKTVTEKLTADGSQNDTYTVTWRVVSSDGHPIQDTFQYTVGNGATSSARSASSAVPSAVATSDETTQKTAFTATNIAIYVGAVILLIGALAAVANKARRRS